MSDAGDGADDDAEGEEGCYDVESRHVDVQDNIDRSCNFADSDATDDDEDEFKGLRQTRGQRPKLHRMVCLAVRHSFHTSYHHYSSTCATCVGKLREKGKPGGAEQEEEEDTAATWGNCGRGSQIWQLDSRELRATSLVALTSKAAVESCGQAPGRN